VGADDTSRRVPRNARLPDRDRGRHERSSTRASNRGGVSDHRDERVDATSMGGRSSCSTVVQRDRGRDGEHLGGTRREGSKADVDVVVVVDIVLVVLVKIVWDRDSEID